MDENAENLEFEGDITDYWSYTQVRDWVLLVPGITRTALHLYLLLRAMVSETARRTGGGLRRMSVDQLCYLLPGINDKPCSPTMVKDALRLLAEHGLVVNPDGDERLITSTGKGGIQNSFRKYQVNDLPPDVYTGWRNVWDKLDAYTTDWRENPAQPPVHTRTDDGKVRRTSSRPQAPAAPAPAAGTGKSAPPAGSGTPAPKNSRSAPAAKATPKKPVKKAVAPGAGADPAGDVSAAAPVVEAWASGMAASGHPYLPKRAATIGAEATELLAAGANLDHLCRLAEWMGRVKPSWKSIEDAMTWPEAPQASLPKQRSGPPMCERHPAFEEGDCSPCRLAERERRQRQASGPESVNGADLLARLRAGQPA
ncbi:MULTISPECIES: hypothetical protein [unclassified Streptomyces]|uniref:hypothetical protein n=1 Tax=unclassified Streptomyces TaxID=2593676 RepID=UPI000DC78378|nr:MULTISPECIES: hypothetical protein [unclassified Streptomyces]AWZ07708.1 hypothetical protein DRB89_27330 [Streptomyces sp. ICC4]AWZ12647.1 hypothetical protein DRB96_10290 [Streptomyces sp. ICC1]